MSDATAEPAKKGFQLKTFLGTLAGLLSGAFMMYVSPLLTKVVQPARPLANFGIDHSGLTVTFYNHSTGGSEGWLDYGDGTPLEPVSSKQTTITHTYPAAETYNAKLTWRSLLGDENERSVKIELEPPRTGPPSILSLEAIPITPGAYAPATFRLVCKSKNAKLCVWDCGDDRRLEFCTDTPDCQEHLVTFQKAGGYMVKVAAVNGDQGVEKTSIVYVDDPPAGNLTALITVTDQAKRVEKIETSMSVATGFPPHSKDDVYRFDRQVPARQGYQILDARMDKINDKGARNLAMTIDPDKQSVHLTGELVRDTTLVNRIKGSAPPPGMLVRLTLTQQRQVPDSRPPVAVSGTLSLPGQALLGLPPMPDTWVEPLRQLRMELRDGDKVLWQGADMPRGALLTLQNRRFALTATPLENQVRVDLTEVKATPAPPAK
jgi:PKD repeat protein